MDTLQLERCMRQDKHMERLCLGCFPSDKLPTAHSRIPFGLVANTQPSTKEGEHWVALWVGEDGYGEYFDSYAQPPLKTFAQFLNEKALRGWDPVLEEPVQTLFSTVCGQHCIYYLYRKCRGDRYEPISDTDVNDFVEQKFALDLCVLNVPFLVKQVCKAFVKNAQ